MLQQILTLSEHGQVLKATGKLFPKPSLLNRPARQEFPLLDSIWDSLPSLPASKFPLRFPFVENPHAGLKGFYHLHLQLLPGKPARFQLRIERCTQDALRLREELQAQNQQVLKSSRLPDTHFLP